MKLNKNGCRAAKRQILYMIVGWSLGDLIMYILVQRPNPCTPYILFFLLGCYIFFSLNDFHWPKPPKRKIKIVKAVA